MKVTILSTSHIYGQITADNFKNPSESLPYGLSRAYTLIEDEKEQSLDPVVYIDNGDYSQATPLTQLYNDQELYRKNLLALNKLRPTAGNLGNMEFNKGIPVLEKTMYSANFLTACGNVMINGKPAFGPAFVTKKLGAIKIGILGLTHSSIPNWQDPEHTLGMDFVPAVEAAERWIPVLQKQEKCDAIVVAYNGVFEKNPYTGEIWDPVEGQNEAYALLNSGLDFDVLITGHQDSAIADTINGIAVIQPSQYAQTVGKIVLDFDRNSDGNIVVKVASIENIPTKTYPESEDFKKDFQKDIDFMQEHLNQVVAETDGQFKVEDVRKAQLEGHAYLDLINEIQREAVGADLSARAFYDINESGFSQEVTRRELFYAQPISQHLHKVKVSGSELRDILEYNALYFEADESGQVQLRESLQNGGDQIQNFDIFAGLDYDYDFSRPRGERLVKFEKEGQTIQDNDWLTLAVNSYRVNGGGAFPHYSYEKVIETQESEISDLIFHYLAKNFPKK